MKKIAIFWEERFSKNNYRNLEISKTLNPFLEIAKINGMDNTISSDLLDSREDKDSFIIICFLNFSVTNIYKYIKLFIKFPRNKKYFFAFEPNIIVRLNYSRLVHSFFNKVYTWNDSLVDNKKYFKYLYPSTLLDSENLDKIDFSNKKFAIIINGNKAAIWKNELYSERDKFIRYAEKNNLEFDLFGTWWGRPNLKQKIFWYFPYPSYRWLAGNKVWTLSQYKFNICFENMSNTPGYITEKIWDSFKAGTIPVYWGASNIEQYVPKNCFIDYRDFLDFWKLESFLLGIQEDEYNSYIKNIELFLQTKEAKRWFDEIWANDFIKNL